jgi:hypothetical protein
MYPLVLAGLLYTWTSATESDSAELLCLLAKPVQQVDTGRP